MKSFIQLWGTPPNRDPFALSYKATDFGRSAR